MPAKPIANPRLREVPGRSPSQTHATSAPKSGTVAFRMDDRPVLMFITAKEYNANGMPELRTPTNRTGFQCWRSRPACPRRRRMGQRNIAAIDDPQAVGLDADDRPLARREEAQIA